jgi:hypothetical protein
MENLRGLQAPVDKLVGTSWKVKSQAFILETKQNIPSVTRWPSLTPKRKMITHGDIILLFHKRSLKKFDAPADSFMCLVGLTMRVPVALILVTHKPQSHRFKFE